MAVLGKVTIVFFKDILASADDHKAICVLGLQCISHGHLLAMIGKRHRGDIYLRPIGDLVDRARAGPHLT